MSENRKQKESMRAVLAERFNKAQAAFVAEYRGLTVAELTELRVELKKQDAEFRIIKNRVAKKALEIEATDSSPLSDSLKGPVGVVYTYGDLAAGAKAAVNFAKDHENFKITGGVLEGKALSMDDIKNISDLPSKEVLLTKIVSSLVSPHRGLLGVLNGVNRNLVQVINAIKDKKTA